MSTSARPIFQRLLWPGIGRLAVAVGVVVALLSAVEVGGGPNYLRLPTVACLRADGFTVNFLNTNQTPYELDKRSAHWVTRYIQRDGQGLAATFTPSPALAQRLALSSDFTNGQAWIRRNVVFEKHTRTEDGAVADCLRSGLRG